MSKILSIATKPLSGWVSAITLPVLLGGVVVILFLAANVKSYLFGSELQTLMHGKPKPQPAPTVKWLTSDPRIIHERVTIPVEVIRAVPAKVEKKLSDGFNINLQQLHDEKKELLDVLDVPKAPHGGEMAITVSTETGKIAGTFHEKPAPMIELGGLREIGAGLNPINHTIRAHYRQDLLRVGPAILNGEAFASVPMAKGTGPKTLDYGVEIGVSVRF